MTRLLVITAICEPSHYRSWSSKLLPRKLAYWSQNSETVLVVVSIFLRLRAVMVMGTFSLSLSQNPMTLRCLEKVEKRKCDNQIERYLSGNQPTSGISVRVDYKAIPNTTSMKISLSFPLYNDFLWLSPFNLSCTWLLCCCFKILWLRRLEFSKGGKDKPTLKTSMWLQPL